MVSVVILSLEPPKELLGDLELQTYKDFEVIVAREKGIVNAMNIALDKAKGDIFVRLDDDIRLPIDWLEELVKPFENPEVAGSTGPTYVPKHLRENRDSIRLAENPNWFLRWLWDHQWHIPAKIFRCGSVSYASNFDYIYHYPAREPDHLEGTNWAMRTSLIRLVGGFDPAFSGVAEWFDDDVVFKVKKLGYKLVYNINAYVVHELKKGTHYAERFGDWSRISNWLRFHWRHSRFHYKKVIWLLMMIGYTIKTSWFRS